MMYSDDGGELVPRYIDVESWFINRELGLSSIDGPSIFWTLAHLAQINRAPRDARVS